MSRKGLIEKIGTNSAHWELATNDSPPLSGSGPLDRASDAAEIIRKWLDGTSLTAISHRFVHGGTRLTSHCRIDAETLDELRRAKNLAPEHVPAEIEMVEAFENLAPGVPQIACFDTVFHSTLSPAAFTYAVPKRWREAGVRRFGFHGLSYEHLANWVATQELAGSRCIFAHLGNGASMAAVRDGACVDTTMGFTPAAGLVMGTRCGDTDPGIVRFLSAELGLSAGEFDRAANHESGMKGLSETSADVRDLLAAREADPRARLALDVFCWNARKQFGALASGLGGLDHVIFTGGIGQHSAWVRDKILSGLEFLGIALDPEANDQHRPQISMPTSTVVVHIVPADEEAAMLRITTRLLSLPSPHQIP